MGGANVSYLMGLLGLKWEFGTPLAMGRKVVVPDGSADTTGEVRVLWVSPKYSLWMNFIAAQFFILFFYFF